MTRIRRSLFLVVTLAAVVLGVAGPAAASFSDTASATLGVNTVTVAAPGKVSTGGTRCVTTVSYDAYGNANYTTTLQAKVSWTASGTRGVDSYQVLAVFSNGFRYPVAVVGSTATSLAGSYDAYYATQNIRVVVITHTSYGWTAESAPSGVITC